ncbi:LamG-like jellyroll fold domain-containing protein [Pedobacter cryophilus]|uniref:PKD domain-containing protein n=1 Tax=Pedobacter cryophilus TaxID=2571271 RepID=A0A4U1C4Y2_9SPHI|nr:LamG-like jellyroll fold domain-containing protein [Pedobacter cryophilus]TKC00382.1 hypothetical protein FA046_01490 [Pedobacter cryophilus]
MKNLCFILLFITVFYSCKKKDSIVVDDDFKTKVSFEVSNTNIFEGDSIKFTNTSSLFKDAKFKWTFEGGSPNQSKELSPVVKYFREGFSAAKLMVYSKDGKDSVEVKVIIQVNNILKKGLVLHYDFDGNTNDKSGNLIHGNSSQVLLTTGKAGVLNSAYQFNGSANSYIKIPSEKLILNNYTYCLWVYLDQVPVFSSQFMPFSIGNIGGDQHFQAMNNVSDGDGWAIGAYNKNYNSFFKASNIPLEAKKWYLLIATRSDNTLKLFVDCNLVGEVSSSFNVLPFYSNNEVIAKLGCRYDGSFPLKGKIDEFRIYNRVLSVSEINKLCHVLE